MAFNTKDIVHTDTGDVTGFLSGSITVSQENGECYSGSKWTGATDAYSGSAYTVGDIVHALKDIGVLAA